MNLNKLRNSPEKLIPIAMALIVVGLSSLVIAIVWPRVVPPIPHIGANWNDFVCGFMYGLAIALEIGGLVLATLAANSTRNRKSS